MSALLLAALVAAAASPPVPAAAPAAAASVGAELDIVKVRDRIYMLVGPSGNTAVQFGSEGTLVVNTQTAAMAPKILAAIRQITDYPIRYILNTNMLPDNTGGNIIVTRAGRFINDRGGETDSASILAHENTLNRMSGALGSDPPTPTEGWPLDAYFKDWMDLRFNGEAVQLIYAPAANTDGDSIVFFRGSDVICAGNLFMPEAYPVIDVARGGSSKGIIDGLNHIIDLAVPDFNEEGGTLIISGHGRVTDEAEVVNYRDMLVIVRDRVQDMIKQGMSLQQVLAAKPTRDYDGVYGTDTGAWTTAKFVEALYQDLRRK